MPKEKLGIRDILALNLKLNRQKCGLTQEKLAEKAGISANYLSMVEISKKFPTPEMLDRLAAALDIDTIRLFDASAAPEESALLHLEKSIIDNINKQQQQVIAEMKNAVKDAVKETLSDEYEKKNKACPKLGRAGRHSLLFNVWRSRAAHKNLAPYPAYSANIWK